MAMGEFDFVIACNDVGAIWPGHLSAWVSLHPEKMGQWRDQRRANGHPEAARYMSHGDNLPSWMEPAEFRFHGQDRSGSSGLFAVKVALMELGADRAVLAGIPLERSSHFFDRERWEAAVGYRAAWEALRPCYRARMRSMSGWTAQFLGTPTADWINEGDGAEAPLMETQSMTKIVTGKIAYEPHPVSPERKAELRAEGFKIIDAAFRPADLVEAEVEPDPEVDPVEAEAKATEVEADAGASEPAAVGTPEVPAAQPNATIKHKGGGSYAVLVGEEVIASGLSKAEAEARAAAVDAE